jgi:hypothetical protein
MNDLFDSLAKAFAQLTFKTKIFYTFLVIIGVAWIDSQMGFTYHYFTDRKIDEIRKYGEVLKDTNIDAKTRVLILNERIAVINKGRGFVESIKRADTDKSFLFHLSYSWILGLLIIFSYWLIKKGNRYSPQKEVNQQTVGVVIILLLELVIIYLIASFMSRYLNGIALYVANSLLQLLFLIVTFYLSNRHEKMKKMEAYLDNLSNK